MGPQAVSGKGGRGVSGPLTESVRGERGVWAPDNECEGEEGCLGPR